MRLRSFAPFVVISLLYLLSASASAQTCPGAADQFWKNDNLPQNPSGATAVAVVPGLCPGEASGSVFNLTTGQAPQHVKQVSVGFGAQGGVGGKTAQVNIEIYDGVTWNGTKPVLGPKVFDYNVANGSNVTVQSHGINVFDISSNNVLVGQGTTAFAVVFRMVSNTNGSCAAGYTANFFTDATSTFSCSAKPKANLMFILGQGFVDPSNATVSGFPLCPLFYNGNFAIRACTEAAICQVDKGFAGPGDARISMCGGDLSAGTSAQFKLVKANANVVGLAFVSVAFNPTFAGVIGGTICPVPALTVIALPTNASGEILVPVPGGGGPAFFFVQMVTPNAAMPKGYEVTNCLQVVLLA